MRESSEGIIGRGRKSGARGQGSEVCTQVLAKRKATLDFLCCEDYDLRLGRWIQILKKASRCELRYFRGKRCIRFRWAAWACTSANWPRLLRGARMTFTSSRAGRRIKHIIRKWKACITTAATSN